MKKLGFLICISVVIVVTFPLFNLIPNMMNAAGEEQQGEKVIDFEYTLRNSNGYEYVYVITENRYAYASKEKHLMNYTSGQVWEYFKLMLDQNGDPVSDVAQISSSAIGSTVAHQDGGMILRTDGQIYFWGINTNGRFGNGTTSNRYLEYPTIYETGISDISQVLSLSDTNFIVTRHGEVYASGDNSKGQFGNGTTDSSTTWIKVPINDVKKIARGGKVQSGGERNSWMEKQPQRIL